MRTERRRTISGPRRRRASILYIIACVLTLSFTVAAAQDLQRVELPDPDTEGGLPLMKALAIRSTSRSFSPEKLPLQVLGDLLWASSGINRPGAEKLTAPTARNWQEIDVYVALEEGLYLYDRKGHALEPVLAEDIRGLTGTQGFTAGAPVNLVYVSDYTRMGEIPEESKKFYSATDTGFIGQNVYLYCASAGLANVVRGLVDRDALAEAMGLRPEQHVVLAHTVGYPADDE